MTDIPSWLENELKDLGVVEHVKKEPVVRRTGYMEPTPFWTPAYYGQEPPF